MKHVVNWKITGFLIFALLPFSFLGFTLRILKKIAAVQLGLRTSFVYCIVNNNRIGHYRKRSFKTMELFCLRNYCLFKWSIVDESPNGFQVQGAIYILLFKKKNFIIQVSSLNSWIYTRCYIKYPLFHRDIIEYSSVHFLRYNVHIRAHSIKKTG